MDDTEPFPAELLEKIARGIHERYRNNQHHRKPASDPAMQPWEALAPALQQSNRAQAAEIPRAVARAGYRIVPLRDGSPNGFSPEELERLARFEHRRWVEERTAAGWTVGPVKDVAQKRTPYLVPWEELAEEVREYDRDAVRAIPEVLALAGLGLFRS